MHSIIKRDKLLEELKKNREEHTSIFLEAVEGYRKEALELLEENIEMVKAGKIINLQIMLPVPEDHTIDYDRVIKMIELDVRDEIELEEFEFSQYVMDDWAWKRQWVETVSNYASVV